jgi:hypothetical protein
VLNNNKFAAKKSHFGGIFSLLYFLAPITLTVIPAKAEIQCVADNYSFVPAGQWIPACAGMTMFFFFVIQVFFLPPVWGRGDKGSFLARTE